MTLFFIAHGKAEGLQNHRNQEGSKSQLLLQAVFHLGDDDTVREGGTTAKNLFAWKTNALRHTPELLQPGGGHRPIPIWFPFSCT